MATPTTAPERRPSARRRRRLVGVAVALAAAATLAACKPPASSAPPSGVTAAVGTVSIMGPSRVSAAQLAQWFNARSPGGYRAAVDVGTLASFYISEGAAEGVRGDVAFLQSIVETGWFRFTGSVPPGYHNYAGIGATDSGGAPAQFFSPQVGVRAQIQHLRAYADPSATTCSVPPLASPCVDPRFHLVAPKGKAPTWNQMGNGNWATSTTYASTILNLYGQLLGYYGLSA